MGASWTEPIFFTFCLAVAGFILTILRDSYQRRVLVEVKPELTFKGDGFGDLTLWITNTGFRPFTLISIELRATEAAPKPIDLQQKTLAVGESMGVRVDDPLVWIWTESVYVRVAPGKNRLVKLPHLSWLGRRRAAHIQKVIRGSSFPYQWHPCSFGSPYFGAEDYGFRVDPRVLSIVGNDTVGSSRVIARSGVISRKPPQVHYDIINHLLAKHPDLFEPDGDEELRWKKSVVSWIRCETPWWRTLFRKWRER